MEILFITLDLILLVPVLLLVGILFTYQLQFISTNTTTIESYERDKVDYYVKKGKIRPVNFQVF